MGEGFVPSNPGPNWGLGRPNTFQPPTSSHRHPPILDVLDSKRSSAADRGACIIKSSQEGEELSTNVVQTQTQISGFVKDKNGEFTNSAAREASRFCSRALCLKISKLSSSC